MSSAAQAAVTQSDINRLSERLSKEWFLLGGGKYDGLTADGNKCTVNITSLENGGYDIFIHTTYGKHGDFMVYPQSDRNMIVLMSNGNKNEGREPVLHVELNRLNKNTMHRNSIDFTRTTGTTIAVNAQVLMGSETDAFITNSATCNIQSTQSNN